MLTTREDQRFQVLLITFLTCVYLAAHARQICQPTLRSAGLARLRYDQLVLWFSETSSLSPFCDIQAMFMTESIISDVAAQLNLPEHLVRTINMYQEGDQTHFGQAIVNNQV
jgi:hypothetical protein